MKPKIDRIGATKPDKTNHDHIHFDSVAELHDTLMDPEKHPSKVPGCFGQVDGANDSTSNKARDGWDGNAGWKGAVEMSFTGWDEGGDRVRSQMDMVADNMPKATGEGLTNEISFALGDEGEEINVDLALEGDDMCWTTPVFQTEKPIIRVMVNIGVSAGISAKVIEARGVVIATLVCKLERLGYGVQVFIGDAGRNGTRHFIGTVKVKDSNEYMHENGLAFWLAHPAALRRIMFRMIELADHEKGGMGCGYGQPISIRSSDFDFVSDDGHIDRASSEGWSSKPEAAAKAAYEMIQRIVNAQNRK